MSTNSAQTKQKGMNRMFGVEKHESTGQILRRLRGENTQQQIADDVGVTVSAWAMYERDERRPRDEVKERIAKRFGMTVQAIFFA